MVTESGFLKTAGRVAWFVNGKRGNAQGGLREISDDGVPYRSLGGRTLYTLAGTSQGVGRCQRRLSSTARTAGTGPCRLL